MAIDLYRKVDSLEIFDDSKWRFQFDSDANKYKYINDRVLSVNTPFLNLSTTSKSCGRQFITGYEAMGEIEVSFLEGPKLEVQRFLMDWKESVFNSKTFEFQGGGYLTGFLHFETDSPGSNSRTLRFLNLQIISIGDITYDYSGSPLTISASFIASKIDGYLD